jgi:hypothetical protein
MGSINFIVKGMRNNIGDMAKGIGGVMKGVA